MDKNKGERKQDCQGSHKNAKLTAAVITGVLTLSMVGMSSVSLASHGHSHPYYAEQGEYGGETSYYGERYESHKHHETDADTGATEESGEDTHHKSHKHHETDADTGATEESGEDTHHKSHKHHKTDADTGATEESGEDTHHKSHKHHETDADTGATEESGEDTHHKSHKHHKTDAETGATEESGADTHHKSHKHHKTDAETGATEESGTSHTKSSVHYVSIQPAGYADGTPSEDWRNPEGTNWNNDGAKGNGAIAVGSGATADAYSVAVGMDAKAQGNNAVVAGNNAHTTGEAAVALGTAAYGKGNRSVAVGYTAVAQNTQATALGDNTLAYGKNSTALGAWSVSRLDNSVALGPDSVAVKGFAGEGWPSYLTREPYDPESGIVSIGAVHYNGTRYRRIINLAGGAADHDAVNVAQLKALENATAKRNGDNVDVQAWQDKLGITEQFAALREVVAACGKATGEENYGAGLYSMNVALPAADTAVSIKGDDKNIKVTSTNNTYTVALNPNIQVQSLQVGQTAVQDGKISGLRDGMIAAGSTEGITGNQLFSVCRTQEKGIAGTAALAALHAQPFSGTARWNIAAGIGSYGASQAVALGVWYRPDDHTVLSVGGTVGSEKNIVNAGISWKIGSSTVTNKENLVAVIQRQEEEIQALKQREKERDQLLRQVLRTVRQEINNN